MLCSLSCNNHIDLQPLLLEASEAGWQFSSQLHAFIRFRIQSRVCLIELSHSRYAHMLRLAHDAIQRHHSKPAMLYLSLDQVGPQQDIGICPLNLQTILPWAHYL